MAEARFEFKDDQGNPRPPTAGERWEIQKYLNDQHPLGKTPAFRSTAAAPVQEETIDTPKPTMAAPGMDTVQKSLDEILASQQRSRDIEARHAPRLEELRKAEEAEIERQQANRPPLPKIPEQPSVPKREGYFDPTIGKSLFAVAAMIAGLGMAGGRGRGMLAMAGMRGMMKGYNEGNQERYEAGMKEYKAQMDAQIDAYNVQYKNYMAILNSDKLSLEQKMQQYDLEATRQQDELGKEAANRKDISEMIRHTTEIQKFANEAETARLKAEELPIRNKMLQTQLDIAKARERTALINEQKAREKQAASAQAKQQISHINQALQREQKTLDQMQKEEKGLHSFWDTFGASNKPLKNLKVQIQAKKKSIQELQDKLNQMSLAETVRDAVGSATKDDFEVGEALPLP